MSATANGKRQLPPGIGRMNETGHITIPREVRDKLGLKGEGSTYFQFVVEKEKGEIRLIPVELTWSKKRMG